MTRRYLGQAQLAEEVGLTRSAISVARTRAGGEAFPAPDVMIGDVPGWDPARLDEIRAWLAARPGRGAGAGRPRSPDLDEIREIAEPAAAWVNAAPDTADRASRLFRLEAARTDANRLGTLLRELAVGESYAAAYLLRSSPDADYQRGLWFVAVLEQAHRRRQPGPKRGKS